MSIKKIIISIFGVATLGVGATTVPVVPNGVPVCYLGNDPLVSKQFENVFCDEIDVSTLTKAEIIEGEQAYYVFKNDSGDVFRLSATKEFYENVNRKGIKVRTESGGYKYHSSYLTIRFNTPSGDLETGFYAEANRLGHKSDVLITDNSKSPIL